MPYRLTHEIQTTCLREASYNAAKRVHAQQQTNFDRNLPFERFSFMQFNDAFALCRIILRF